MSGVIGIIGKNDVAAEIFQGLVCLQHRGQDGGGISTFDEEFHIIKDAGLVTNIFSKEDLKKLQGKLGIGHVRYPSGGAVLKEETQPFYTSRPCLISLVQSGKLTNYNEMAEEIKRNKEDLLTKSEAECILKLLASEWTKEKTYDSSSFFSAVGRLMKKLKGCYTTIGMTPRALFAFRDQHGIKPMAIGEKDGSFAIASETVALDVLGYKVIRDLIPGEAVFITRGQQMQSKQILEAKKAPCMFEWVYFARTDSVIERLGVYEARQNLGRELAKEWQKKGLKADIVIPVPDTARPAALAFAEELGMKFTEGFIKNRYIQRTFIMANQSTRETAMKLKLNPIIKEIKGKSVAVVDDSLVRGTTSKWMIQMLRNAGAKEVHFLLTCPPLIAPCYYDGDMTTKTELPAASKSTEEIRKAIGADSLTYQSMEGLRRAIGFPICAACSDGVYPAGVPSETYRKQLEKAGAHNIGAL